MISKRIRGRVLSAPWNAGGEISDCEKIFPTIFIASPILSALKKIHAKTVRKNVDMFLAKKDWLGTDNDDSDEEGEEDETWIFRKEDYYL